MLAALGVHRGVWTLPCIAWPFSVAAHGLSCCATCRVLGPQPGIKPASPALEGGFLITGPPGKSPSIHFIESSLGLIKSYLIKILKQVKE